MNFHAVTQGIELARRYLRPMLQVDLSLAMPSTRTVGWRNRVAGINRDVYYPLEYQYLLDRSQYSFLLSDSSFLQMFYRFDDAGLVAARLAYYPAPLRLSVRGDDFLSAAEAMGAAEDSAMFDHLLNWYEAIDERRDLPLNSSHFRFDFDRGAASHPPSHMQFGAIQELRISADHFPLPLAFVELIRPCISDMGPIAASDLQHARNHRWVVESPTQCICVRGV